MDIERGLLWNIEPAISRGVQVNYASGPLTVSVSWNDGYYSNVLNTLSGLVSYVFSPADTLAFSASGDVAGPHFSDLDSGSIYDLIWTHTDGNWVFSPYLQYSVTPSIGEACPRHQRDWRGIPDQLLLRRQLEDGRPFRV